MRARLVGLVGVVALATVACGVTDPGVTAGQSRQSGNGGDLFPTDPTDTTVPGETLPPPEVTYDVIPGVVDFGSSKPAQDYDGFLTAAFGDIQAFWADAFPEAYSAQFDPLSGGIYAAYPDRTEEIPGCGSPVGSTYDDVASLGAFYCIDGDFMAYDDSSLLPSLVNDLGREAVAVVLAHEFGHAVQARAGEWEQPGVLKEQQADCFAGAWSAHVASGASDLIRFDDRDVRSGLVAMINVRDPVEGSGLNDPEAHGTGFDRVGAFQDGFEGGVVRCAQFFTEGRLDNLIDIPWDPDQPTGNLPLIDANPDPTNGPSDIITLIPQSLEFFWTDLAAANGVPFTPPTLAPFSGSGPFPSCDGIDEAQYARNVVFCAADNTIYWDEDYALALSEDPLTGDMSVGYLISNAYSEAIQHALNSQTTGEQRQLFNDCLTGAWVGFIVPPIPEDRADTLQLSAGDLDEAVVTAIARSDASADTNVNGLAFQKVDAFRTGVLGGLNLCRDAVG